MSTCTGRDCLGVGDGLGCMTMLLAGEGEAVGAGLAARRGLASCVRAFPVRPAKRSEKLIRQAKSISRDARALFDDFILRSLIKFIRG